LTCRWVNDTAKFPHPRMCNRSMQALSNGVTVLTLAIEEVFQWAQGPFGKISREHLAIGGGARKIGAFGRWTPANRKTKPLQATSIKNAMSAFGTKQTSQQRSSMSAFGGIADIGPCLLYPQKRTLVERVRMSALCQKRTLAC